MIRNYMRVVFPKLVDVFFALSLACVLVAALAAASAGYTGGITTFFAIAVPGALFVTLAFGGIYVLLDIRDSLEKLPK
jgi:hypothetical protein